MPQPWKFSSSCRARSSTASGRAPGPALKLCTRRVIRFFSEKLMLVVSITSTLAHRARLHAKNSRPRALPATASAARALRNSVPRRHWKVLNLKDTSTALLRRRAFDDADAAMGEAGGLKHLARACDHLRSVKQYALQPGIVLQDCGEQDAVPARHVD